MVESIGSGQFTVGQWTVTPALDRLERDGNSATIEPTAMAVLEYLARRADQVIATEELVEAVWKGKIVGDDAVYQRIHRLRKVLEDDPHHARYIETIPRKGYRLVVPVKFPDEGGSQSWARRRSRPMLMSALALTALFAGGAYFVWQQQDVPESRPEASAQSPPPRSIAVLPFVDLSEDQDQKYLGDGIAEELIHALSNVPGLKVAARTSAFRFSDKDVDIAMIGAQLNVETVLEGSVRRSGDRVRITAQLVSVADGYHLWSKTFDRDAADLITIQKNIAMAVVEVFGTTAQNESSNTELDSASLNIAAYDYYLLGRHHQRYRTEDGLEQSISFYRRAIELDPGFARAFAGLAIAQVLMTTYSSRFEIYSSRDLRSAAETAAKQALAINDTEPEAHAALGEVRYMRRDWAGAEASLQRALELDPNYAHAYVRYAMVLSETGRDEEALQAFEMAAALDPLSAHTRMNLGVQYGRLGQEQRAMDSMRKAIELEPGYWLPSLKLANILSDQGRLDEAVLLVKEYLNQRNDDAYWPAFASLTRYYQNLNDVETAQHWFEQLASSAATPGVERIRINLLIARGDFAQAETALHALVSETPDDTWELNYLAQLETVIGHDVHALGLYEQLSTMPHDLWTEPEGHLFDHSHVQYGNLPAVNAAHLYLKANDSARARELLEQSRTVIMQELDDADPASGAYYVLATIDAIEGDKEQAFQALRQAFDAGWRRQWFTELDPNLESLRDDPRFPELIAEIEADLAVMRQRLASADVPAPANLQ